VNRLTTKKEKLPLKVVTVMVATTMLTFVTLAATYRLLF
jgi:hypothetical protein